MDVEVNGLPRHARQRGRGRPSCKASPLARDASARRGRGGLADRGTRRRSVHGTSRVQAEVGRDTHARTYPCVALLRGEAVRLVLGDRPARHLDAARAAAADGAREGHVDAPRRAPPRGPSCPRRPGRAARPPRFMRSVTSNDSSTRARPRRRARRRSAPRGCGPARRRESRGRRAPRTSWARARTGSSRPHGASGSSSSSSSRPSTAPLSFPVPPVQPAGGFSRT